MNDMRTEIIMVLDRSGSMSSCADDVVGGFNSFIEEQKQGEGEAYVTLAQFDTQYEMVYEAVPVTEVKPLEFHPRGSTALLDAVGRTVGATKERLQKQRPGADVVIFVVITDGQENASREYQKAQVTAMTKECEDQLGWKFVYLGANQDAFAEAGSMGIGARGIMSYDSSGEGTRCMFTSLSKGTSSYREKTSIEYSAKGGLDVDDLKGFNDQDFFSDEDRKKNESKQDDTKFGMNWK